MSMAQCMYELINVRRKISFSGSSWKKLVSEGVNHSENGVWDSWDSSEYLKIPTMNHAQIWSYLTYLAQITWFLPKSEERFLRFLGILSNLVRVSSKWFTPRLFHNFAYFSAWYIWSRRRLGREDQFLCSESRHGDLNYFEISTNMTPEQWQAYVAMVLSWY